MSQAAPNAPEQQRTPTRFVCVVGAGAAGICAARHLAADRSSFRFEVLEQSAQLGGTWVYSDAIGVDENGIAPHSSMYKNLRTNFLQEVMGFPDEPFPENTECSYPTHEEVLNYLRGYAQKHALLQYIRFRTIVQSVRPLENPPHSWEVSFHDTDANVRETKTYDAVMLCAGYYSKPLVPFIHNIESFQGDIMHSHYYRTPDKYAGLTVAVLGASFSGKDIAIDISYLSKKIYLCHNLPPLTSKLPENIKEVPGIKSATKHGFLLADDSSIEVDALLYCTGYQYDFPFLSPECGIKITGKRVRPLYKHFINIEKPTMAIVGIPYIVVPFPIFFYQVALFLATLKKSSILPSKQEMYEDEDREFQMRLDLGFPSRHAHKMAHLQWDYVDALADLSKMPRLPPMYQELCKMNSDRMTFFFGEFRKDCYAELFKQKLTLPENNINYNLEKQTSDGN